jgi:Cu/Ag efflux protein CusF
MIMKKLAIVVAAMLLAGPAVFAAEQQAKAGEAQTVGEVRKVDKAAKKITIKHGPITNLDMPAMTMVFQVKDPSILERVKAGDKIKFRAEDVKGALTVTRIETAQ